MTSRTLARAMSTEEVFGDKFGIEVEVEQALEFEHVDDNADQRRGLSNDLVSCVHDGSLRDRGCEFIFAKPLEVGTDEFNQAVQYIQDVCEELDVVSSFRTSTHFHMNISDLTKDQVMNVLFLSVMIEPALMEYCSDHRKNNRFCIPWESDYSLVSRVHNNPRLSDLPWAMQDYSKYAATSLHRMADLGTIEYRMFDSIWDADTLRKICRFFASVRSIACTRSITEIREDKIQGRLLDNLSRMLRDCFGEKVPRNKLQLCLERGVTTALDLIEKPFDYNKVQEITDAITKTNTDTQLEQGQDSETSEPVPESSNNGRPPTFESWVDVEVVPTTPTPQPAPSTGEPRVDAWNRYRQYSRFDVDTMRAVERTIQRWQQENSVPEDEQSGSTDT